MFSPSNKIHREVGRAKYLPAPLYIELRIWVLLYIMGLLLHLGILTNSVTRGHKLS